MSKPLVLSAAIVLGMWIGLTAGAGRAAAQGPAGAGAAEAAQDSSRAYNPMKWIKKGSGDSTDDAANRGDLEKKLTPMLQTAGVLPTGLSATDACAPFTALSECLAALHASHDLGINFFCLRADDTGVHTNADVSGCKVADGDKAQGLSKAVHQLKPDANARQATKRAEQQARDDLSSVGG
jgi:hypothetical protein